MSETSDITAEAQAADIDPAEPAKTETAQPAPEPRVRRLNIIGQRNWFFLLSLVVIIPGIVSMATQGFLLGIDFAGGTEFTVNFADRPSLAQVESAVAAENINGSVIQTAGGGFILRYPPLNPAQQTAIQSDLQGRLGPMTVQQILAVGGTIAGETITLALLAVVIASAAILLLLAIRFRNVPGGWRAGFQFGGSALLALLHDVFILTGIFSILGKVFGLHIGQIDSYFVTAVLTVVGFSVHDTIVVFDRIRENMQRRTSETFEQVVNASLVQTMARSLNTSLTVLFTLSALTLFGGTSIRTFTGALLIGIFSGTYSSIFNASMLLVIWEKGELFFGRFNRERTPDGREVRELVRSGR